jgi:hypothetical protein
VKFLRFWWEFVIGDDWRVAAGIAAALVVTFVLAHDHVAAWWLMPAATATVLLVAVWR